MARNSARRLSFLTDDSSLAVLDRQRLVEKVYTGEVDPHPGQTRFRIVEKRGADGIIHCTYGFHDAPMMPGLASRVGGGEEGRNGRDAVVYHP